MENAICEEAVDYLKKKHVLRLITKDGGEYLFDCKTESNAHNLMRAMNDESDRISALRSNYNPPSMSTVGPFGNGSINQPDVAPQRPPPPPDSLGVVGQPGSSAGNLRVPASPTSSESEFYLKFYAV